MKWVSAILAITCFASTAIICLLLMIEKDIHEINTALHLGTINTSDRYRTQNDSLTEDEDYNAFHAWDGIFGQDKNKVYQ